MLPFVLLKDLSLSKVFLSLLVRDDVPLILLKGWI